MRRPTPAFNWKTYCARFLASPLEDVQRLTGHADPRTTRLYDRRDKKLTRNIVERISI